MARAGLGRDGQDTCLLFWCPGCDEAHAIRVDPPTWAWNNTLDSPTLSPSILIGGVQWSPDEKFHRPAHTKVVPGGSTVCHSFVTDGRIQYLADSTHALAGQTVDLPEWEA